MKKILYTATVLSHICQFHLPYLQALQEQGVEVHVAARDNLAEKMACNYDLQINFSTFPFSVPQRIYETLRRTGSSNCYWKMNIMTALSVTRPWEVF